MREELARISDAIGSDPSKKIAEAIRTSRTTGQEIDRVRIAKDGDAQITAEGVYLSTYVKVQSEQTIFLFFSLLCRC